MKLDAEVAVVGLGTMGSMAFWRLARRNVSVIGLEQFNFAHDRSAAGGESRQFRQHLLEPFVLRHTALGYELFRELEAESGSQLLQITGGLTLGRPDSLLIRAILDRSRYEGYPVETLDADQMRRRYPQHRLAEGEIALFDEGSGCIRPEFSVAAAIRTGIAAGGVARDHVKVNGVHQDDGHVRVETDQGEIRARRAIVSGGAWLPRLADLAGVHTYVRRILMTWFPALDPASFAPSVFPTWTSTTQDDTTAFGLPTLDGGSVKVALVESYGDFADADQLDYSVRQEELDRVTAVAAERLPGLMPTAVRQSAHMDLYTPDEQPLVGPAVGAPDIILGGGFSGRGFKFSPAIGETLAAAALGDESLLIPEWAPDRFTGGGAPAAQTERPLRDTWRP